MLSTGLDPAEQSGMSMLSSKAQTEFVAYFYFILFYVFRLLYTQKPNFKQQRTYKDVLSLFLVHASLTYSSLLVCLGEL